MGINTPGSDDALTLGELRKIRGKGLAPVPEKKKLKKKKKKR